MSSREIAELTGKRHADVMRDARNMFDQLGLVASSFAGYYVASNGKSNPLFNLPKDLTLTLVSGYSVPLRHRIVTRLQELESAKAPAIRTDDAGRFNLNDLHKAAGGENRHKPSLFLARASVDELRYELKKDYEEKAGIPAVSVAPGRNGGTWVVKELVYAYAMWISPKFHIQVIRA